MSKKAKGRAENNRKENNILKFNIVKFKNLILHNIGKIKMSAIGLNGLKTNSPNMVENVSGRFFYSFYYWFRFELGYFGC
jgi:hypothetical protein